jgi:distribution and morphology protein 31
VNIDHIQAATTEGGPMSWIKSGKVDAVLDIKFPHDTEEDVFDVILGEIADAITTATTSLSLTDRIPGQRQLAKPPLTAPSDAEDDEQSQNGRNLIIDIDLRFRDLKAAVPIFTNDLSYVNNAAIRPIVAFMKLVHCYLQQSSILIRGLTLH